MPAAGKIATPSICAHNAFFTFTVLHNFCKVNNVPDVQPVYGDNGGDVAEHFHTAREIRLLGERERQFLIDWVARRPARRRE